MLCAQAEALQADANPWSRAVMRTVSWRAGRRGDGGDVRGGFGPDEKDRARGVVDDEPGGLAEALRAQPGPVAVSGDDEQVRAGGCGHHLPFGVTTAFYLVARAAE